ncbi:hypothetical protein GQ42DRAFT_177614 [Ramicandelaber brevisporus]|nr:hypothetical protein GQ42DRAFT_177614 [Ramicandelaber brevisporus]
MVQVLVFGACSFVGRHLIELLVDNRFNDPLVSQLSASFSTPGAATALEPLHIRVVDRTSPLLCGFPPETIAAYNKVDFMHGNLWRTQFIEQCFTKPIGNSASGGSSETPVWDLVINVSSVPKFGQVADYSYESITGNIKRIARAAERFGARRLVHLSSSYTYENTEELMTEDKTPLKPGAKPMSEFFIAAERFLTTGDDESTTKQAVMATLKSAANGSSKGGLAGMAAAIASTFGGGGKNKSDANSDAASLNNSVCSDVSGDGGDLELTIPTIILRPALMYGPSDDVYFSTTLMMCETYRYKGEDYHAMVDEKIMSDTVHLRDVARAIIHSAIWQFYQQLPTASTSRRIDIFNVTDGSHNNMLEVAQTLGGAFGLKVKNTPSVIRAAVRLMPISKLTREVNDKVVDEWEDIVQKTGIKRTPRTTSYIDAAIIEMGMKSSFYIDGSKLIQRTGFAPKYPKLSMDPIKEIIAENRAMNYYPQLDQQ